MSGATFREPLRTPMQLLRAFVSRDASDRLHSRNASDRLHGAILIVIEETLPDRDTALDTKAA
jgi:hypothetical protein